VIDKGPYRWIRHPGYAAGFGMFIGIGFAPGNWLSLIIFFLEICYVYSRRVKAEEKALLGTIGEPTARLSSPKSRVHGADKVVYTVRFLRFGKMVDWQ